MPNPYVFENETTLSDIPHMDAGSSRNFPDDSGLNRQIGSTWPFWRSPPPPPTQFNPLRSITFHNVTKIVELIVIKMHLSREFGSNA
jgi:hypothetical protein